MGSSQWHAQVLHLALTQDYQTHERPCAFRIVVDQVVDNHAPRRANDQRDQQDCHPTAKPIIHHCPTEDQDWAPQGPIDQYVQNQGHHRN
jgi:hypothetical protein